MSHTERSEAVLARVLCLALVLSLLGLKISTSDLKDIWSHKHLASCSAHS